MIRLARAVLLAWLAPLLEGLPTEEELEAHIASVLAEFDA